MRCGRPSRLNNPTGRSAEWARINPIASEPVAPMVNAWVTAAVSSAIVARSNKRRTLMYSRVPAEARSVSRRRRSSAKQSGSFLLLCHFREMLRAGASCKYK